MPFKFSTLQDDKILHTRGIGKVTNKDLIEYYQMILSKGYREKYFVELVDCSKVTEMLVDSNGHEQLSKLVGGTIEGLIKNIELLKADKISIKSLFSIYPKLLINEFRIEKFSKVLGLKKNQKQATPPKDPKKVLSLLEAYLDSFINAKLAMYGKTPQVLDIFYDWKAKSRKFGYSVEVFDDLSSACAWLLNHPSETNNC
jgi:hypothetical protein